MNEQNKYWDAFIQILKNCPNNQIENFVSYFVDTYESNKKNYLNNKHICCEQEFDNLKKTTAINEVFLSVVVRTQGKRNECLQLTFDSLNSQVNHNFEIELVCHKVTGENKKKLEDLIEKQSIDLRKKIRVHFIEDGNRTAPLNYGFSVSRGQYIAVLDDDDVATENWVEEFYKASLHHNGQILHAYVEEQFWYFDEKRNLVKNKLKNQIYCEKFSIHSQLEFNRCPINGLAFPSYSFKKLFITFDETLTTNEDWDFFMRTSFVTGVFDIEKVTAIYVRWKEYSNSYIEHSKLEWINNIRNIKKKFDDMPILYPAGEEKSQIRYEMRPINFYHLFKIYKRTLILSIICPLTFFVFKKLNHELKENKALLKKVKHNDKKTIYKL